MTLQQLTELLGWAALINIAYLLLATFVLMFFPNAIMSLHSKLLTVDKSKLAPMYFNFLSIYKVMTLVFIISPYLALKIMGY
ncbi:DUF6868 family protein [Aliiglaciecola lipolytica]|uniref:DUF6868 family protein n=1 Tax=Aliiglaciecola lipolytica TaxID=477689 RepID=UPI00058C348D|nr:hypothetical protein [Aliiglaciecola lipolytica]